ncbi:hypothetical protein COB64_02530 [Candidatus Wolfebacteria bacterium]|nr:MAG: hypothetical protein COB64_02530 [Candidatus Wolfebacteria bacterium]
MPPTKRIDKFYHYESAHCPALKNKILIGINSYYEDKSKPSGKQRNPSIQDLLEYLRKHKLDPSKVEIAGTFFAIVRINKKKKKKKKPVS